MFFKKIFYQFFLDFPVLHLFEFFLRNRTNDYGTIKLPKPTIQFILYIVDKKKYIKN